MLKPLQLREDGWYKRRDGQVWDRQRRVRQRFLDGHL